MSAVDVLSVMHRYDRADALEGLPGFDRYKYLLADAARSYVNLIAPMAWNPTAGIKLRAEAMCRYARLRAMRKDATRARCKGEGA